MDTKAIQHQCEQFLKSLPCPAFIVLGIQSSPHNVELIYSLHDMPLKGAVKGLTKTLDDLLEKI